MGVGGTDCALPGTRFDLTLGKALRGGDDRSTAEAGRGGGGRFPGDGGGLSILSGDVVCALGGGGGGEDLGVSVPA